MNSLHSIPKEITVNLTDDEKRAILAWNVEQSSRLRYSKSQKCLQWRSPYDTESWPSLMVASWSLEYFYLLEAGTGYRTPPNISEFNMSMIDVVA